MIPDFPGFEPMPKTAISKGQADEDIDARLTSLFRVICGEDGKGVAALQGAPRPTDDGS